MAQGAHPLPSLLARALTLCAGEVATESRPETPAQLGAYVYVGVPPDVAATVMDKTGQGLAWGPNWRFR